MGIKFVQQTEDSCFYACLAMVAKTVLFDVKANLTEEALHYGAFDFLTERGVPVVRNNFDDKLQPSTVYILMCPSLNKYNTLHVVVLQNNESSCELFDPNEGRTLKAYTLNEDHEDDLRTYIPIMSVPLSYYT